jgi:hypothetical protein
MGICEAGTARQHVDARICIHDALIFGKPQLLDASLLLGNQRGPGYSRCAIRDSPERTCRMGVCDVSRLDEDLGRDAADVDASPAHGSRLDEGDLRSGVYGADRCGKGAAAAAEDRNMEDPIGFLEGARRPARGVDVS